MRSPAGALLGSAAKDLEERSVHPQRYASRAVPVASHSTSGCTAQLIVWRAVRSTATDANRRAAQGPPGQAVPGELGSFLHVAVGNEAGAHKMMRAGCFT